MVLLRILLLCVWAAPLWAQTVAEDAINVAKAAIRQQNYVGALAALQSPNLQNNPDILLMRASLYQTGRGVARDDGKTYMLTLRAAELGSVEAQYSLGRLLLSGRGVEANRAAGQAWVARAAEAGHIRAAALLVNLLQSTAVAPAAPTPTVSASLPAVAGSDISRRLGWTPLMEAARRGQHKLLEALLATSNLEAQDNQGRTALMLAAEAGDATAIGKLLTAGAALNTADKAGNTALGYAVQSGQEAPSLLLLTAGALANQPNTHEETPLTLAIAAGQSAVAIRMLKQETVSTEVLERLWFLAAQFGARPLLQALAEKGAQCEWQNSTGDSVLDMAAREGNVATITFCLGEQEVDAAMLSTPLIIAANFERFALAQSLLNAGADVNSQSQNGNSPLLIAARKGNEAFVMRLIEQGANINHRNQNGNSALMLAALNGHEQVLRALLDAGADVDLRNKKREQAVDIAQSAGHTALAALLE